MQRVRAVGVVVASAAADALGAPHEFGPALPADAPLAMTGGGSFDWEPGEWTDDTQQALGALTALATTPHDFALADIEDGLRRWYASHPRDVGLQTRSVLERAYRDADGVAAAAAAYQLSRPEAAGNGSLMRTGPIGLAADGDLDAVASLATEVSALTHPHPDAVDACVLWSTAIARAIRLPIHQPPDWVALVGEGLVHLDPERWPIWSERLDACRTTPPEEFTSNGWVVGAFQAALSSIAQTAPPPDRPACAHLRLAIERVVRIGGDTDTVAAIAGSLLGAYWGATAVPFEWRRPLHGRRTYDEPHLELLDLDRLARLAASGGKLDADRWPAIGSLLPHYRRVWPTAPLLAPLADGVTIGNVHALPEVLDGIDAVVSLCRMGTTDVSATTERHVIGLLDTTAEENPNLDFVLADTADLIAAIAAEGKRVFVHCVQAQNRTPAVAATYLVRHEGLAPSTALDQVEALIGTRPQPFLTDAVSRLGG